MAKPVERSERLPDCYPQATEPESLTRSALPADRIGELPRRHRQHLNVEPARPASATTVLMSIASLHNSFIREEGIDDDLNALLGGGPTGVAGRRRGEGRRRDFGRLLRVPRRRSDSRPIDASPDVIRRAERMSRLLGQLVNIAQQRARREPGRELAVAISQAERLRSRPAAATPCDQGHLRRLALVTLELLEALAGDDHEPLPTFDEPRTATSRGPA